MSRIVKFRGWSVEEKKMYQPAYPTWMDGVEVWEDNKPQTTTNCYYSQHGPEEQMILEQFTGLTDKNGVEIYEGDVLSVTNDISSAMKYTVIEAEYGFGMLSEYEIITPLQTKFKYNDGHWSDELTNVFEVIGNIHKERG